MICIFLKHTIGVVWHVWSRMPLKFEGPRIFKFEGPRIFRKLYAPPAKCAMISVAP